MAGIAHDAVATFRDRRRHDPAPAGYEIHETAGDLFKIRVGEKSRAATWYDEERDVVFLVVVGSHESGTEGDFYKWVPGEWRRGRLAPTDDDYADVTRYSDTLWSADLRRIAPDLIAEAQARAARGEPTESAIVGTTHVHLLAVEIDGSFYYAARFDPRSDADVLDYARVIAMCMIIGQVAGVGTDFELHPVTRWRGLPLTYRTYAFELG
ncbi:MAG TPA: hypothetical protein VIF32_11290 [Gemmatimonadaceae bacterium]